MFMNQRRVLAQRVVGGEDGGQRFVLPANEPEGFLSRFFIDRGDGGDDIANVSYFFTREELFVLQGEAESLARHVRSRQNRSDAR